jgi:hypothetical protein
METEKSNLYKRYKKDVSTYKKGYYDYELWLENKLIEAESELKKLRVTDVSVSVCNHPLPYRLAKSDVNYECTLCGKFI